MTPAERRAIEERVADRHDRWYRRLPSTADPCYATDDEYDDARDLLDALREAEADVDTGVAVARAAIDAHTIIVARLERTIARQRRALYRLAAEVHRWKASRAWQAKAMPCFEANIAARERIGARLAALEGKEARRG